MRLPDTADVAVSHAARLLTALGATGPRDAFRGHGAAARQVPSTAVSDPTALLVSGPADSASGAVPVPALHPDDEWAACGAMELTGRADGPPLRAPGAPASAARGALLAYEALLRLADRPGAVLPGAGILAERAALTGMHRRGPVSAGGSFRLMPTADSRWLGLSLARPSDEELVPALVEDARAAGAPWDAVTRWATANPAEEAAARAQLLGVAAAAVPVAGPCDAQLTHRHASGPVRPFLLETIGEPVATLPARPLVVDLSSLWAGPLCAHLLGLGGMRVVKVESTHRPDGARRGNPAFYDLLHGGHESVAVDFTSGEGRAALRELLAHADVVIEASRPRALAQMGITPRQAAAVRPGLTWLSITGYGRSGPWADRVGFGDDIAAAAGLVAWDEHGPVPCGDALADPLTGAHAAVAVMAGLLGGGGLLIDVAMRDLCLAGAVLGAGSTPPRGLEPAAPLARMPSGSAPASGADTRRVLAAHGIRYGGSPRRSLKKGI